MDSIYSDYMAQFDEADEPHDKRDAETKEFEHWICFEPIEAAYTDYFHDAQ